MVDVPSLESFLLSRLREPLPGAEAQWRFSPKPTRKGWSPDQRPDTARQAAALILIYPSPDGPCLPLTVRHSDLPQHAGQISLPGGRVNVGEAPVQAALREAQEEIGIDPARVRIAGELSSLWVVVSNHLVRPFVGVVDARPDFALAPHEVETLLEVPVADLLDRTRIGWSRHAREGIVIDYPHFDLVGHQVWGATAMMLGELGALFEPDFGPA